jgi:carbon-monoxide dehydrogenase medium subunit
MRPFEYQAPTSIDEAVALLADQSRQSRPLAGGTDLLVQLRQGLRKVDLVVDVKRISELNRLSFDPTDGLTVGAAVSCARLCAHPDVQQTYPALVDGASIIGGAAIQSRATLGGNLCNAAPSGDGLAVMILLGATCTVAGPGTTRTVPAASFCTGPGETVLGPGELVVSIHFPAPLPRSGAHYLRFTPRREMDIAVAGAGAWVVLSAAGAESADGAEGGTEIVDARIALAAVAPTPLQPTAAAAALIGSAPTEDAFAEAAQLAQEAIQPISDVRGTATQRRHLVGVLVRRALRGAVDRAQRRQPAAGKRR